jgi:hypothetical protein
VAKAPRANRAEVESRFLEAFGRAPTPSESKSVSAMDRMTKGREFQQALSASRERSIYRMYTGNNPTVEMPLSDPGKNPIGGSVAKAPKAKAASGSAPKVSAARQAAVEAYTKAWGRAPHGSMSIKAMQQSMSGKGPNDLPTVKARIASQNAMMDKLVTGGPATKTYPNIPPSSRLGQALRGPNGKAVEKAVDDLRAGIGRQIEARGGPAAKAAPAAAPAAQPFKPTLPKPTTAVRPRAPRGGKVGAAIALAAGVGALGSMLFGSKSAEAAPANAAPANGNGNGAPPAPTTKTGDRMRKQARNEGIIGSIDTVIAAAAGVAAVASGVVSPAGLVGTSVAVSLASAASNRFDRASSLRAKAAGTDAMVTGQTKMGALYGRKARAAPTAPGAYLDAGARAKAEAAPSGTTGAPRAAATPSTGSGPVEIPGYTRSDGTTVKGYTRQRGQR